MKNILTIITTFLVTVIFAQEGVDISTPQQSSFNSGQNIEGWVQGSVNEPTGKVTFAEPLAAINSRTVSYNVALGYNGQLGFDMGSYTNKYAPTSTVGVGFSLGIPKIIADNKGTATKEDDTFYLQDGATNSKLVGINRIDPGNFEGKEIWEFEAEQFVPWKIQYYKSENRFNNTNPLDPFQIVTRTLDYWVITNDQGIQYIYGQTQNSRENQVAWGNWIGSSIKSGGKRETIVWNLYKIKDQWENNLRFEYELQESTVGGVKQTEASYIKQIISSTGESIQFTYENKNIGEYYEPNINKAEPDAYQERYEKRALKYVDLYNESNALVYRRSLTYTLVNNSSSTDKKRYLQSITQENSNGDILPGKRFEYHTSGAFKGGLKKINYAMGGSVTYTYKNKLLFTNTANRFTGTTGNNSGYYYYAMVTKDNYTLTVYKSVASEGGKHDFKINRNTWDGTNWKTHEFVFSYKIKDEYPDGNRWLENFITVFGNDYYGFIHYEGDTSKLDLFHLNANGRDWDHTSNHFLDTGDGVPSFLSGDNFVVIGSHRNGKLYTYTWDGNRSWNTKTIAQGNGQYYYGATNNYILSLDEDGGADMITNTSHADNYYIHYLNMENEWITKSWSAAADPYISGIEKPSYFYPVNSMSGFVADDNPELFLRWDTNYNLLRPDNVLGLSDDSNPIIGTYSGMHTLQGWFYQNPIKMARFNGLSWNVFTPPSSSAYYAKPAHGEDFMTFQNHGDNRKTGYAIYDPNTDAWKYSNALRDYEWYSSNSKLTTVNREFMISGTYVYNFTNASNPFYYNQQLPLDNGFVHTDGLSHAFAKLVSHTVSGGGASEKFEKGMFFYKDKKTNIINTIDVGKRHHMSGPNKFAGRTPFISPNSLYLRSESSNSSFTRYLYRVINDRVDNTIYDIVIDKVTINNGDSENRINQYTFSNPGSNSRNSTTFYGDVILENKGYGTASIGRIEKKYNNGNTDLRVAGLLLEERIKNTSNEVVSLKTNIWKQYDKSTRSYTIKLTKQSNTQYLNEKPFKSIVESTYSSPYYLNTKTKSINSVGQIQETSTKYAYSQYEFMNSGNYVSQPYEVIDKLNDQIISVDRTIWLKNSSSKIYTSQILSGTSTSNLRLSYEISRINSFGQVEESNNGKGQSNTIIYGYNYRYPIASISNATYNDVISNLSTNIGSLQNMDNINLRNELLKLYALLPNSMTEITLYDQEGKVLEKIDNRQESTKYYYDNFNRVDYLTDHNNYVVKKNVYNYGTN